ncbi:MAG: dipeptidase PepE [Candidatus Acidiferrales bacterium]
MKPETNLLLISSSFIPGGATFLDYCAPDVLNFYRTITRILFIPYALKDHAAYTAKISEHFSSTGFLVDSLHESADQRAAIDSAEAFFVGGGNTFRLLDALYARGLLHALRNRVRAGAPYLGISAGTNLACPTIKTTNDMPIVFPPSLDALSLVPFQINPHFIDAADEPPRAGETREQRLAEFHEENSTPVLGLREGAWLEVAGHSVTLRGAPGAKLFQRNTAPIECAPNESLDSLLG